MRLIKLDKKGQSMVEMALILPVILLLFLGMFEFSRIFGSYLLVNHASREAARMASIGKTDDEIKANVAAKVSTLDVKDLKVILTPAYESRMTGDDVRVQITYKVQIYAPVISNLITNPFPMEADTYMRVE
ncbi:MAG: TadE/TadG family type IV pilus assembly protein [Pseudomonadota bacterium]